MSAVDHPAHYQIYPEVIDVVEVGDREPAAPGDERTCVVCGASLAGKRSHAIFCSKKCRARRHYQRHREEVNERNRRYRQENRQEVAERNRRYRHRRRAQKMGAGYVPFSEDELWESSDKTCVVCGDPISPNLAWPDPMSRSLEHLIPLSQGGTHSPDNCGVSHLICNLRKGTKTLEEVKAV